MFHPHMIKEPLLELLTHCTHLDQADEQSSHIRKTVKYIYHWEDLPSKAEEQGMAPLLNFHLRKFEVEIPEDIQRSLSALALRHKLINEIRTNALSELNNLFSQQEIPFLVVKGAALAHLLYPSPALRPMKDMDLLVKTEDCDTVTQLLIKHGYRQIIDKFFHPSELHLPTFSKEVEGFSISIEVHHRLLPEGNNRYWGYFDTFRLPNKKIKISEDTTIETINLEEFLYHLCKHTFFSYHNLEPLRMIWVADICNFSEKFKNEIDWVFLNQNYPLVRHTLAALYEIFPLSADLIEKAHIKPRKNPERMIRPYGGWPGIPMRDVNPKDRWKWMNETIFPSTWALFLHYGNSRIKAKWYNWLKHILNLLGISLVHLRIRLRSNSH